MGKARATQGHEQPPKRRMKEMVFGWDETGPSKPCVVFEMTVKPD